LPAVSFLSPRLEARDIPEKGYRGVFAREPIAEGDLLALWGGAVVDRVTFAALPEVRQSRSLQVDEDLFLVPPQDEDADFVNHSCDPNAWIEGHAALRARRDIAVGDEICFDYAMTDGSDYDEFECLCGAVICRQKVTGSDWELPELQARYGDHFSPYLLRRIRARGEGGIHPASP
jgi:SET domain-containing protein